MIKTFSFLSALVLMAAPAVADTNLHITFDPNAELSVEESAKLQGLAECIVNERKGKAKKFLNAKGDRKLLYLAPMIMAPCLPESGSSLNVALLEVKLKELINA